MTDNAGKPVLRAVSALAHMHDHMALASSTRVHLRERLGTGQWNLRADPEKQDLWQAICQILGTAPPTTANRAVTGDGMDILWLGPDEWLICADDETDLQARLLTLAGALRDHHHALTDVSDNRAVLDLCGPDAMEILKRGCGFPVDQMQPGDCVQTLFARANIILRSLNESDFRLYVRQSFAEYLAHFLMLEMEDLTASDSQAGAKV